MKRAERPCGERERKCAMKGTEQPQEEGRGDEGSLCPLHPDEEDRAALGGGKGKTWHEEDKANLGGGGKEMWHEKDRATLEERKRDVA